MTEQEYAVLRLYGKILIDINDLENKTDRTLIYGYTTDRDTFHLYLDNGNFVVVTYGYPNKLISYFTTNDGKIRPCNCIPNKRVYPAMCDYEFCKILDSMKDITIPFTTYDNSNVRSELFYGLRLHELIK